MAAREEAHAGGVRFAVPSTAYRGEAMVPGAHQLNGDLILMNHIRTLTAAVALIAGVTAAGAADLLTQATGLKDGSGGNPSISGPYFEVAIGEGFSQDKIGLPGTGIDLSGTGGLFNLRAGYDLANVAGRFGLGVYGEGSNTFDVNGKVGPVSFGENWGWGAGGKVFYDHGTGQLYLLAGYAGTDVSAGGVQKTLDGFQWGGGISMKLTKNVYAKMEFDQIYYSDLSAHVAGTPITWAQTDDRVLVGIGYSLGGK